MSPVRLLKKGTVPFERAIFGQLIGTACRDCPLFQYAARGLTIGLAAALALLLVVSDRASAGETDAEKLVDTVGKAVVTIKTGNGKTGSGYIVDKTTVVTNFHVISGALKAEVVFHDKSTAEITGFWGVSRECDVALLSVKVPADKAARAPKTADELPKPGEKVYAFGAPLSLSGSISDGIVSAVRRGKEIDGAKQLGYEPESIWIQTTAPISPGNSGGPIVNSDGEVLGLATWTDRRGQNINFATSSVKIAKFIEAWLFVTKQENKLSDLPKPLVAAAAGGANPNATLEFWNTWARLRTKARPQQKPPAKPLPAAKTIALHERLSKGFLDFAGAVTNLKTHDVDPALLEIIAQDAAIHRRLGEAWSRSVTAIRDNNQRAMARDAQELEALNRQLTESDNSLTQVRFGLSKAYGIEFPSFFQKADDSKEAAAAKGSEGAREVKRARLLIEAGKQDEARTLLKHVQEKHPGTPEADDAENLLKSLK